MLPLLALCASCALQGCVPYEQQWEEALRDPVPGQAVVLLHRRLALVASQRFSRLPEPTRHERLLDCAQLAEELKVHGVAHRLYVRASLLPSAGFDDWAGRLAAASGLADRLDMLRSLTQIARSWPGALSGYSSGFILRAATAVPRNAAEREAGFELRLALHEARFTREDQVAVGELWGLLAADLLERGRLADALAVISDIDAPRTLLAMQVDRRFAALLKQAPGRFDVMAAQARLIAGYEQAVARQPRSLAALARLARAYLDAARYADAMRATGAALGRVQDPEAFHAAYDDDPAALGALLHSYARALMATQSWEDATGVMELAAQGVAEGAPNSGNVIDLGAFYARLGRAGKALAVLDGVSRDGTDLPPCQRMRWQAARLTAALAAGNAQRAHAALSELAAHRADAPRAYEDALLALGREDTAALLLITRLHDRVLYRQALLDVQTYSEPPAPAQVKRQRARWRQLVSRSDVQRAIARAGRIGSWPLPAPGLCEAAADR